MDTQNPSAVEGATNALNQRATLSYVNSSQISSLNLQFQIRKTLTDCGDDVSYLIVSISRCPQAVKKKRQANVIDLGQFFGSLEWIE